MSDTLQESGFETRLLLASLVEVLYVLDTEGEAAVAWYKNELDARTILNRLLEDHEKRPERLARIVCTLSAM
jgi:hypothetical protein